MQNQRQFSSIFSRLVLGAVLVTGQVAAETTESTWPTQTIVIDGSFADWKNVPTQFNADLNLVSAVSNDQDFLYVMIRFQDAHLARKMNLCGSTLWLNYKNQKDKNRGIRYFNANQPTEPDREKPPAEPSEMPATDMPPVHGNVEMTGSFSLKTKDATEPITDTAFKSAAAFQNGFYCFEYQIPLAEMDAATAGRKIKPGEKFKIGLEIEAVSPEIRAKMEERMKNRKPPEDGPRSEMGMPPSGRGPRGSGPGGGMPHGGGPMGGDRPQLEENQEIWFTIRLVAPLAK